MTAVIRLCLAAMTCGGLLAGCDSHEPITLEPPAPGVILEVDGLRVSREEIQWWLSYVHGYQPTAGRKSITAYLLETHLLPLKAAQRDFGATRAAALEMAENLRAVAGNSLELQRKATLLPGYLAPRSYLRIDLEPAVLPYVFAPENLGGVSDPIETPRGFMLASGIDLTPGGTSLGDRITLCRVNFWTQDDREYGQWFADLRQHLKGKVTYLDPEFEGALPHWIMP